MMTPPEESLRSVGKESFDSKRAGVCASPRPRVLLTSVCRPMGAKYGDASSVGYELLHEQVTRAQGIFSPRATHLTFGLDYIALNLDSPAVVLHYPSRRELVGELRKNPDFVGVSFTLSTFHKVKEIVALIREHAPSAKVVLGGYGTVLDDQTLAPLSDHICRGEGVQFFRRLLGEPERSMPYEHPMVVSRLRVFSIPVSRTGMIFAGLGCPHGCDFCCTSHFFKRRHIRLLPTGDDVMQVIERYHEIDPKMSFTIIDEDFLVNRERAARLRELVLERGKPISIFAFATVKALSRLTPQELLETGIDGVWVGFEGKRSGFAKQQGRPVEELIPDLQSHGISVLTSMIVGFDYQTPDIIRQELAGLIALKPTLTQFLIYGPTPGTPFFARVEKEGRLRKDLASNRNEYYRRCDGFTAMVEHPTMASTEIEGLQRECFETDFRLLGPSIVRSVNVWFQGWKKYRDSTSAYLRAKADRWAEEIRRAYPIFPVAQKQAPNAGAIAQLRQEIESLLGPPTLGRRFLAALSPVAAAWTRFTLNHDRFQHPSLNRRTYHNSLWALPTAEFGALHVRIERALAGVRVGLEGTLDTASARWLAAGIQSQLRGNNACLQIVVAEGTQAEPFSLGIFGRALGRYRDRISVALPPAPQAWAILQKWLVVLHEPA